MPWFDYYDAGARDLAASEILAKVKTVDDILDVDDEPFVPVDPKSVVSLIDDYGDTVPVDDW